MKIKQPRVRLFDNIQNIVLKTDRKLKSLILREVLRSQYFHNTFTTFFE